MHRQGLNFLRFETAVQQCSADVITNDENSRAKSNVAEKTAGSPSSSLKTALFKPTSVTTSAPATDSAVFQNGRTIVNPGVRIGNRRQDVGEHKPRGILGTNCIHIRQAKVKEVRPLVKWVFRRLPQLSGPFGSRDQSDLRSTQRWHLFAIYSACCRRSFLTTATKDNAISDVSHASKSRNLQAKANNINSKADSPDRALQSMELVLLYALMRWRLATKEQRCAELSRVSQCSMTSRFC